MTAPDIDTLALQVEAALHSAHLTHGLGRALRAALNEIELYRNHRRGQTQWPLSVAPVDADLVQLGGGAHVLPGFLNLDVVPPADILWDLRESIPLADDTARFIFSEHFLEHIDYPMSAKRLAAELYRVTRPGGEVVIGVPDAGFVLDGYFHRDPALYDSLKERWYGKRTCQDDFNTWIDLVNYVFRDQDDDPVYHPHLWAYDYDKLVSLLGGAGFTRFTRWPFDPTIANPKREWGSLYVVATK